MVPGTLSGTLATLHVFRSRARRANCRAALWTTPPARAPWDRPRPAAGDVVVAHEPARFHEGRRMYSQDVLQSEGVGGGRSHAGLPAACSGLARGAVGTSVIVGVVVATVGVAVVIRRSLVAVRTAGRVVRVSLRVDAVRHGDFGSACRTDWYLQYRPRRRAVGFRLVPVVPA